MCFAEGQDSSKICSKATNTPATLRFVTTGDSPVCQPHQQQQCNEYSAALPHYQSSSSAQSPHVRHMSLQSTASISRRKEPVRTDDCCLQQCKQESSWPCVRPVFCSYRASWRYAASKIVCMQLWDADEASMRKPECEPPALEGPSAQNTGRGCILHLIGMWPRTDTAMTACQV